TICAGDSAVLLAGTSFGNINWYDASSGGNLLYTGNRFTMFSQQSNASLYLETESMGCISPTRKKVSVVANTFSPITNIVNPDICAKNSTTLSAKIQSGRLLWYDSDTASQPVFTGLSYTTEILNGSKTFYVRSENKGCFGPKIAVTPIVKASPFSGFSFQIKANRTVMVSPINIGSSSVFWDFGDGTTSTNTTVNHRYTQNGSFNIKLILTSLQTGCKDSTIIPVSVDNTGLPSINSFSSIIIYPNPSNGNISVSIQVASTQSTEIQINDLSGKCVYRKKIELSTGKNMLNVETGLSKGLYIFSAGNSHIKLIID
ncbi:MAG: T9SS type A sorting domain-containing protein, partial [Bacteroidia bacterium]|nr:T9SS type A sorting domain-containing protein [Bacteroidia bacterium]